MSRPGAPSRPRLRTVVLLNAANLASGVGNAVVMLALPWLILERTGSSVWAGAVVALSSLPGIVTSPLAGWMVDHWGRRRLSVLSDAASAASVAAIALSATQGDGALPWIVVFAVVGAAIDPAGYTARRALLPNVAEASRVGVDRLNGVFTGIEGLGWTVGPMIGAALIAAWGVTTAFWVPCLLFVVAMALVAVMRVTEAAPPPRPDVEEDRVAFGGLLRGFTALWENRPLRLVTLTVVVLAAVYLPSETVVLPTYFERLGDPTGLGIVLSSLAAGSTTGAFGYGWLSARLSRAWIARLVLIGTAVAIVPMALLPPVPVLAAAGFLLGLSWGPSNPLMNTLVQQQIPPHEQGRVYGVQTAAFYAAPPIGMMAAGATVQAFGLQPTYLVLAGLLVVFAVGAAAARSIRDLDAPAREAASEAAEAAEPPETPGTSGAN